MDRVNDTIKVGYARCSTDKQEVEAQRQALARLGVAPEDTYIDEAVSADAKRPELDKALVAVRAGDELVVTRLDRFARSMRDSMDLLDKLTAKNVRFNINGTVYDWEDPFGRAFLQQFSMFAEFEKNIIRARTREGMDIARQRGRLKGKRPKLTKKQQEALIEQHCTGQYTITDLAEVWSVSRPTVYRVIQRWRDSQGLPPVEEVPA